jgi:hypothetical protein
MLLAYGNANLNEAPLLKEKVFGGYKCDSADSEVVRWSLPTLGVSYIGQHRNCIPRGFGRFRHADGLEWIGAVVTLGQSAIPAPGGIGEIRTSDGLRIFGRFTYTPMSSQDGSFAIGSTVFRALGFALPSGLFGIVDKPVDKLVKVAMREPRNAGHIINVGATREFYDGGFYRLHRADGLIVSSAYTPGQEEFDHNEAFPRTELWIPEIGVRIAGTNGGVYSKEGSWRDWFFLTLKSSYSGFPPGRYYGFVYQGKPVNFSDWPGLLYRVRPLDGGAVVAMRREPFSCERAFPPGELPPDWVVWGPTCSRSSVSAYAPDASYRLDYFFDMDGKVVRRSLARNKGMGRSSSDDTWTADRFEIRGGFPFPVGMTKFDSIWGLEWGEPLHPLLGETRGADAAGHIGLSFQGEVSGLVPTRGECRRPPPETGFEPCEFRDGQRIDAAYAQRTVVNAEAVALQRQRDAEAAAKVKARRDAEIAAQQAEEQRVAAEEAEEKRRRQQSEAEDAAAYAAYQARDDARRQAENAKFAAEMQANQKSYNDAVANARAMQAQQAQQAEQDRLNRDEAARQERDRRAGERAYAEAQARNAQAKAQAEAAYQQQRQIDQARAQAAASDAARRAAGAYGSGSSSAGSPSGSTASSAAAPAIPAGKQYTAIKDGR